MVLTKALLVVNEALDQSGASDVENCAKERWSEYKKPTFMSSVSPALCVTVTWLDPASSRRRGNTSVRRTINDYTGHAVTAVTSLLQEKWSLPWDGLTTPSALSVASAVNPSPSETE